MKYAILKPYIVFKIGKGFHLANEVFYFKGYLKVPEGYLMAPELYLTVQDLSLSLNVVS